jgi:hypothetical protein
MNTNATTMSASAVLDPSDVPTVAVRELALALKMLTAGGLPQGPMSEDDLRRVEQAFWQISRRGNSRKTAVLLRLRSLLDAMQSRRLAELLSTGNQAALFHVLAAAAKMRLNAKWGFNPLKMARTVSEALAGASVTTGAEGLAVAA